LTYRLFGVFAKSRSPSSHVISVSVAVERHATLPGIASIVPTVRTSRGLQRLIYERIRENSRRRNAIPRSTPV
jgi:preprotein translocase subunit SecD